MNKVLLIGRLANELEIQQTLSNVSYVRFRIAVQRPYKTNEVDFIPVITWKNQADFISKYLTKGALISVEGRFSSSTYDDKDGKKVTRYEVNADRVQSLEPKSSAQARINSRTQELEMNNFSSQNLKVNDEVLFEEEATNQKNNIGDDVPWDVDL